MFKVQESKESNVFKYVFTEEDYVAETVLYRYESFNKRTVICCSTQSGCPVGCSFCGTGKNFARNLTSDEIVEQIKTVIEDKEINTTEVEKFQIMFMSMGEPMLNWDNVEEAIIALNKLYPSADLLLSTIGVKDYTIMDRIINLSKKISKIGLQFSIHKSTDRDRNQLIPFKKKLSLEEIRDFGTAWFLATKRKPYLNYCVDGTNNEDSDTKHLKKLFTPIIFNFTFSVVCADDETMKDSGYRNLDVIRCFEQSFIEKGYDTRVFDPAGQDSIGGGCGQLWETQNWMKQWKAEKNKQ